MNKQFIVYHDNCLDGFMAGILAYIRSTQCTTYETVVVVPANYSDTPVEAESGDSISLVDFSYSSKHLEELLNKGVNVFIDDHHKTFIQDLESNDNLMFLSNEVKFSEEGVNGRYKIYHNPGVKAIFGNELRTVGSFSFRLAETESGASLVLRKFTNIGREFMNKEFPEMEATVQLAREHDLWLHKGDEKSEAYALSHWFKNFVRLPENKELLNEIKKNKDTSADNFRKLFSKFLAVPLAEKIKEAKEELEALEAKMEEIATSDKVKKVYFNHFTYYIGLMNACYVQDPDIGKIGISIMGSYLVRKHGWDIVIMDAVIDDEKHVFSLRSNSEEKNLDVAALCKWHFEEGYAISGGGHTNAAGVAFKQDKKHEFFSFL